MISGGFNTNT
jgi:threonine dehydratase